MGGMKTMTKTLGYIIMSLACMAPPAAYSHHGNGAAAAVGLVSGAIIGAAITAVA